MISVLASVSPATSLKLMPCPCFEATSTLMNLALRSLAWRKNKQCNIQLIHWHNGKIKHLFSLLAAPQLKTLSCRLWECKVESSWTIHTWKVIKRMMCLGWPLHIALTQETWGKKQCTHKHLSRVGQLNTTGQTAQQEKSSDGNDS